MKTWAVAVLVGSMVLTLGAVWATVQHLQLDTDFRALLPPDAPSLEALDVAMEFIQNHASGPD
mgnify:CR=1 FL=1